MARVQAVVFDIDGTLLDRNQRLHPSHRELVTRCTNSGLVLLVATARYHLSAIRVLGDLKHLADQGVFAGGPAVHCRASGWKWHRFIPAEIVNILCETIRNRLPWCRIGLASATGSLSYEPEVETGQRELWGVSGMPAMDLAHARRHDALRLTVWSETPDPRLAVVAAELTLVSQGACRVIPADRGHSIYITATEADKGSGMLALLEHLGIDPLHTIACGDDLTDLPLLRAVGIGIAMIDGHPELLAATPHHSEPSHAGGLLAALDEFLPAS